MLVLAMGLLTTGGVLMYSGLKKGDYWKRPWQPVVDLFTQSQLQAFFSGGGIPPGPPGAGATTYGGGATPGPTLAGWNTGGAATYGGGMTPGPTPGGWLAGPQQFGQP